MFIVAVFILKSILSYIILPLQLSFYFHLHEISFSIFQCVCVSGSLVNSLYLGLIFVFIQSVSFVGAFNPFIFKLIIDMYVPLVIFLIVFSVFVPFVSSLSFFFLFSCFLA